MRKRAKTIHRMPQEGVKIEEIPQYQELCGAKLSPLKVTESSAMALPCWRKIAVESFRSARIRVNPPHCSEAARKPRLPD